MALPVPIPAATLVVFRDRDDGPAELLIVERAKGLAFAGGMLAFPGGRIDPGDYALAEAFPGDRDEVAARIAAIRETIEEAGLPIGLTPQPDAATLDRLRRAFHDGVALNVAMAAAGLTLDPAVLVAFARWCPAHAHARIFDTRFYLARLPAGAPDATVDATENTRLFWASAADALALCDRGEAAVIFPTRRNLERLALFADFDAASAHAAAIPVTTITPWISGDGDTQHLHIPEDAGYPVTSEPMTSAMRG